MYSREIDGKPLTLTTSGFTYFSQHVLFDHETESFWFHMPNTMDLTCIAGEHAGRVLPGRNFSDAAWHAWHDEHPNSFYLKPMGR